MALCFCSNYGRCTMAPAVRTRSTSAPLSATAQPYQPHRPLPSTPPGWSLIGFILMYFGKLLIL